MSYLKVALEDFLCTFLRDSFCSSETLKSCSVSIYEFLYSSFFTTCVSSSFSTFVVFTTCVSSSFSTFVVFSTWFSSSSFICKFFLANSSRIWRCFSSLYKITA
ncbi:ORF278 [White spot syndrome virus]|uniref:ORF278 n=1 Tax=White spot syndrome virus TaxID=342409 RepID=A0A2D3I5H5_9VIRU|nr:ORF278 [White spot syndrome virus]